MIGVDVGECRLGAARARHVLQELAVMAGLPRAEGRPAVRLSYGRGPAGEGPCVVIPAEAEHVAREVAPEVWREGDVDVPLLYRAATPPGEALLHTAAGEPLITRLGAAVYLAFDVVAAADYYLQGRGEVGWPRDRCGRPDLGGAPLRALGAPPWPAGGGVVRTDQRFQPLHQLAAGLRLWRWCQAVQEAPELLQQCLGRRPAGDPSRPAPLFV